MQSLTPKRSLWSGYKFVGDNIDKNVKPRFQRHEIRGQSFHFFHGFAVQDKNKVDFSECSDRPPVQSVQEANVLLPSQTDIKLIKEELSIPIARYG